MNTTSIRMRNIVEQPTPFINFVANDIRQSLSSLIGKPLNEHTMEMAKETASVVLADLFSSEMIEGFCVDTNDHAVHISFIPPREKDQVEFILDFTVDR